VREGDDLIRKMLSARECENSERCANENLMAAYLESSLSPQETAEFEAHIADCAICREVLALSMKMDSEETADRPAAASDSRKTLFRFSVPVVVAGALFLVFILAVYKYMRNPSENNVQVAEVRKPAQPPMQRSAPQAESAAQGIKKEVPEAKAPEKTALKAKAPEMDKRVAASEKQQSAPPAPEEKEKGSFPADLKRAETNPPVVLSGAEAVISAESKTEASDAAGASRIDEASAARPASNPPPYQIDINRYKALNSLSLSILNVTPTAGMLLGSESEKDSAELKKIGDKVFYLNSGIWIDRQCAQHRDSLVVELLPVLPEHESILKQYPELRNLLPALIYWNSKIYLLR
jgi:hypothetical protein